MPACRLINGGLPLASSEALPETPRPSSMGSGRFRMSGVVNVVLMDPEVRVTAADIAREMPTVSRHLVYMWRSSGRLKERGKRGRSPLYRWGDVVKLEAQTREADPAGQRASRLLDHLAA
jgi:hypothetical protein